MVRAIDYKGFDVHGFNESGKLWGCKYYDQNGYDAKDSIDRQYIAGHDCYGYDKEKTRRL